MNGKLNAGPAINSAKVNNFQALTYDEGDRLVSNPRQNNVLNIAEVRTQGVKFDFFTQSIKHLIWIRICIHPGNQY